MGVRVGVDASGAPVKLTEALLAVCRVRAITVAVYRVAGDALLG